MDEKKKKELEASVRAKVGCDKAAYEVQWMLLEPGVAPAALEAAAAVLQPQHYEDVVVERALDGLCGYPLCEQSAPARGQGRQMLVSASERKVYDISSLHNFCGRECAQRSKQYMERLQPVSLYLRTGDPNAASAVVDATRAANTGGDANPSAVDVSDATTSAAPPVTAAVAADSVTPAAALPPPARLPSADAPAAMATLPASFEAGTTLSSVQERPQRAPDLNFAPPAEPGMVEGYAARLAAASRPPRGTSAAAAGQPRGGAGASARAPRPAPAPSGLRCEPCVGRPVMLDYGT